MILAIFFQFIRPTYLIIQENDGSLLEKRQALIVSNYWTFSIWPSVFALTCVSGAGGIHSHWQLSPLATVNRSWMHVSLIILHITSSILVISYPRPKDDYILDYWENTHEGRLSSAKLIISDRNGEVLIAATTTTRVPNNDLLVLILSILLIDGSRSSSGTSGI